MDSLITAAAEALASGDPLGALKRVALRDDGPALALRGIAMAQLGDFGRAKELLRRATRAFSPRESVARARCVVAEAEVALASRDLGWPAIELDAARATLEKHGDLLNATHARYLEVRRLVLIGHLDEAEKMLVDFDPTPFPPASKTAYELVAAGIAIRRIRAKVASAALVRARVAAHKSGIPALIAEVESADRILTIPAARLIANGEDRQLLLKEVEALAGTKVLIVDACRNIVRDSRITVSFKTRPVLFTLARTLAEAWPGDASRDSLLARAFGARFVDESHRMRLRVEIGRLRKMLQPLARITATKTGFTIMPNQGRKAVVLAQPVEDENGDVLAFLADGEAWSSSALATALQTSPRTVQNPDNGELLRTIESNRFVTGVTWVDGQLWHGTLEGDESELRRVDPETGRVLEQLDMPPGITVSGLESDGDSKFFCGGEKSGRIRVVRRPKRLN